MPSLLEHIAFSGLLALPLAKKPKWILRLCWVAVLPDFDIFLGLHRAAFHSLLTLLPICIALVLTARNWYPHLYEPALFASFCLLSHTLFDLLGGYVALLWPLITLSVQLNIYILLVNTGTHLIPQLVIEPFFAPLTQVTAPGTALLLDPLDVTLFITFLALAIAKAYPTLPTRVRQILTSSTPST
ncbi:MAG: hypothetical protein ACFFCO_01135 [Promethearchaeota archaeon]